tara:strand:- start:3602 stop:4315 length:714 start_codon:yes stop_codon:yes gene_type:complete
MIYQNFNFNESYSNANGIKKEEMAVSELGNVIGQSPSAITEALRESGVKVPLNPSKKGLIRTIIKNRQNKRMVKNLSAVIFASSKFDEKDSNFLNAVTMPTLSGTEIPPSLSGGITTEQSGTSSKGGLFKSIGGFFKGLGAKRKERASDPKVQERRKKWGNWFQENKGTIGGIAGNLFRGLSQGGSQNRMNTQAQGGQNPYAVNTQPKGLSLGAKIGIGVGVLAVVGTIIYFATRKK